MDEEEEHKDSIVYGHGTDFPVSPCDGLEKRTYEPLFLQTESASLLPGYIDSYFSASRLLVRGIAKGKLDENDEGIAAAYLFRHYLELSIKFVIFMGEQINADGSLVGSFAQTNSRGSHHLGQLWATVRSKVRPKTEEIWDICDIDFVEQCVLEFDKVDQKSFVFRYEDEARVRHRLNFARLLATMDHVYNVFHELTSYITQRIGTKTRWDDEFFAHEEGDSFIE
jgi:hypothetical protein